MKILENTLHGMNIRTYYEEAAKLRGDMDEYWAIGYYQSILVDEIFKLIKTLPGNKIIDIGCGDGRNVALLAKRNKKTVGLDISFTRLKRTKNKINRKQNNILLVQSYAEKLPVESNAFDGAVCTEVIEHIFNVNSLYEEFSRILKNGAWLLVSIPTVSLKKYFDMRHIQKPIYHDMNEHVQEYTAVKIPWFGKQYFIPIYEFSNDLSNYNFNLTRILNIGFELPLWLINIPLGKLLNKLISKQNFNQLILKLPLLKKFSSYKILIFTKNNSKIIIK